MPADRDSHSLAAYRRKRAFGKTPEPRGKKESGSKALAFVVHKHDASRLHYDLRLEMDGVLKSWAVPKGPSMDPHTKRLAIHVEDHPYAYRTFTGRIPSGQYGAGIVSIWDHGTYTPLHNDTNASDEEYLLRKLKVGHLVITFHGKKLRGAFALVRVERLGEHSWLLFKKDDSRN